MRSFLNIKNINTIFLLLLILVIIYLINTDFTGNENRFDLLSTAYQKTAIQQKYNYRKKINLKNQTTYLIAKFYVLPSYKSKQRKLIASLENL